MKALLVLIFLVAVVTNGVGESNVTAGKAGAAAQIEHFTLSSGRSYDGIYDVAKSQIHVVVKGNHVANVQAQPSDIIARKPVGPGSQVVINSDVDIAEKVLVLNQQNLKAAQTRLATAQQRHDTLHQTYGHKTLPQATYDAVMLQYKATDDELANAQKGVQAASAGLAKAQETYSKAGGKKQFPSP
jgi:hypothetical protein